MYPPVFEIVAADSNVQTNLGINPTKFYPFGEAPQDVELPYSVWQFVTGIPENYLDKIPDTDTMSIQIDAYASTASQARDVAQALRDAIEPHAHITSWRGEDRDEETRNYRVSFDVDFIVSRETQS